MYVQYCSRIIGIWYKVILESNSNGSGSSRIFYKKAIYVIK